MRILAYLLIGVVLLVVYVRFMESKRLFAASKKIAATPQKAGLNFEDIYFSTADHLRLNGWLIKAAVAPDKAATLLFCHGNAGNIGDRIEKIKGFHALGVNVFIFDYRGFGNSQGNPTEEGMYADTQAAYAYLKSRQDILQDRIIAYGASMGGVAALDLAFKKEVSSLILDSTWTSAQDMAKVIAFFVPSFILTAKLDNASKIQTIKVPKLVIHSFEDQAVPFALGQKLFALAPEPKEFLKIAGSHSQCYETSREIFFPGIRNFLDKYQLR